MMALGLFLVLAGIVLANVKGTPNPFVTNRWEYAAAGMVLLGAAMFIGGLIALLWRYAP